MHCVLEFNQFQWLEQYVEFNTQKRIESEKNGDKSGKALYKLLNNVVYRKTMENVRNRIDIKLVSPYRHVTTQLNYLASLGNWLSLR